MPLLYMTFTFLSLLRADDNLNGGCFSVVFFLFCVYNTLENNVLMVKVMKLTFQSLAHISMSCLR